MQVEIRLDRMPGSISIKPSGQPLTVKYESGLLIVNVPRLEMHEIILIE
jgi:hypothetical protein